MNQKLEHFTSIYQAKDLQRQAIVLDQVKNTNESIYYNVDEIHRAISQNRQISFQYTEWTVSKERHLKKGGARYQISPWQMIWQDGNYYLIGVDEKSGILKHYRVDKMLKILTERMKQEMVPNSSGNLTVPDLLPVLLECLEAVKRKLIWNLRTILLV